MRCLLAIGCDAYEELTPLSGAENDARRIYTALTKAEVGEYDLASSRLLLSPTIEELRQAIVDILHDSPERIDTFTFFFAGHGGVSSQSFYLWLKNSRSSAIAATAYCLSDLFRSLHEARPAQTNIIVDACNSGGVIHDLGALLKPDSLGNAGTPGVSVLATAAADEYALEINGCGRGTALVLDCIEGRTVVNDHRPALDLFEIGRTISSLLDNTDQSPVAWGLNICGAPRFCRNPRYGSDPNLPLREVLEAWPTDGDAAIRPHYDELWRAYTSVANQWSSQSFIATVRSVTDSLSAKPEIIARFIDRLASACSERARTSNDPFREVEVLASLAGCLLSHLDSPEIGKLADQLQQSVGEKAAAATITLVDALNSDQYALLSPSGNGISDLFSLPLRIAKCVGWSAASYLLAPCQTRANNLKRLLSIILSNYTLSLTLLIDSQAPFFAITFSCIHQAGLKAEGEEVASLLFHSLLSHGANLARHDLQPEKVLAFLNARRIGDYADVFDSIERPIESLTVVILAAAFFDLEATFDDDLWGLDYTTLAAYVTPNFREYAMDRMADGEYRTWKIGGDIFRCSDLRENWGSFESPKCRIEANCTILCSMLLGDRTPWFLMRPEMKTQSGQTVIF